MKALGSLAYFKSTDFQLSKMHNESLWNSQGKAEKRGILSVYRHTISTKSEVERENEISPTWLV